MNNKTIQMIDVDRDQMLKVSDIQQLASVSRGKAYEIMNEVRHMRIGGALRCWKGDLMAYLATCVEECDAVFDK